MFGQGPCLMLMQRVCLPATLSIFPQVEAILENDEDYLLAIYSLAKRKRIDRYRNIIDFLFCELNPQHSKFCFDFYRGGDVNLHDRLTAEEVVHYNEQLLSLLKFALKHYEKGGHISWKELKREFFQEFAHQQVA